MIAAFTFITAAAATTCIFEGLSYLIVKPMSLALHRRIVMNFSYAFFLISTFVLERGSSMTFKVYGDPIPPNKNSFIILNHSSSVDFLIGLAYLAKLGFPNPGNTKSAVKDALGKVPLFGTVLIFTQFLFLSRSWVADQVSFVKRLTALRNFRESVAPFTLVLFPEGTRLTPERLKHSKEYAESINQQPLNHVLFPRFRGFATVVQTLANQLDGIVDGTFIFENGHPSLKDAIAGTSKTIIHVHTKFHPIDSIPKDEQEMESWLRDRWYEKEKRIEDFHRDPSSIGQPENKSLFPVPHPSLGPLYALVVAFVFLAAVVMYFVSKIPNGLTILSSLSALSVLLVGVFTILTNRPTARKSKTKTR